LSAAEFHFVIPGCFRHSGAAEGGTRNPDCFEEGWIPGSRVARPGMTKSIFLHKQCAAAIPKLLTKTQKLL
jgi:hypothetical protein